MLEADVPRRFWRPVCGLPDVEAHQEETEDKPTEESNRDDVFERHLTVPALSHRPLTAGVRMMSHAD